jgi:hypothetical protein
MRVQLDNGRTQVDLEVENGTDRFLHVLARALKAMDYTEQDLIRELGDGEEE